MAKIRGTGIAAVNYPTGMNLGGDPSLEAGDLLDSVDGSPLQPEPLLQGTTYYWRVDTEDANGLAEGSVWSFETWGPWYADAVWEDLADFPQTCYRGGALCWDRDDYIYAFRGCWQERDEFNHSFWRYSISGDSWERLGDCLFDPYWSASLAWTGGDFIYALQGNGTDDFGRYQISTDQWEIMADTPEFGVRRMGHALVWPGSGPYLYAAKGDTDDEFWRYDAGSDQWDILDPVPEVCKWNSIAWDGEDGIFATTRSRNLYRYDIGAGAWSEALAAFPGPEFAEGANMAYDRVGSLIATVGGGSAAHWAYSIAENRWEEIGDFGPGCQGGACMVSDGEGVYALFGIGATIFGKIADGD